MSFLNLNVSDKCREQVATFSRRALDFYGWLEYYRGRLTEKALKRYEYNTDNIILSKEIELRLLIFGFCGINYAKKNKTESERVLTACDCTLYGITNYYDEFAHYNYTTPNDSGKCKIGEDGILIKANSIREPLFATINRYAMLLAHIKVTMLSLLINGRDNKSFAVKTTAQKEAVKEYYNQLYRGISGGIYDKQMLNIDLLNFASSSNMDVSSLEQLARDIEDDYMREIGVPTLHIKKERMITSEVEFENIMPQVNIKDEFEHRRAGILECNALFGTNWSVECKIPYEIKSETADNESEANENENNRPL